MNTSYTYKEGAISGKFRAITKAHKEYIIQAGTHCELLHIFILAQQKRYTSLDNTMKAIGKICLNSSISFKIHVLDMSPTINDSFELDASWDELLLSYAPNLEVMFNSKENYQNKQIKTHFLNLSPIHKHISVTLFETNYCQFYDYLATEYRPYVNSRIVVSGIESTGKSTLTRRLSEIFNSGYSEEYGKNYHDTFLGGIHETYQPSDFVKIGMGQIVQDASINMLSSRHLFVDTDAVVTLYYLYDYQEHIMSSSQDFEAFNQAELMLENFIKYSHYDLLLLLAPTVPFVQDGTRFNEQLERRIMLHQRLKEMYDNRGIHYIEITSSDYGDRLQEAVSIVSQFEANRMEECLYEKNDTLDY